MDELRVAVAGQRLAVIPQRVEHLLAGRIGEDEVASGARAQDRPRVRMESAEIAGEEIGRRGEHPCRAFRARQIAIDCDHHRARRGSRVALDQDASVELRLIEEH